MGLSQVALAEKLNLNPITYLRYEKGQREPSLALVCDFAKFFDVSADYLLGLTEY